VGYFSHEKSHVGPSVMMIDELKLKLAERRRKIEPDYRDDDLVVKLLDRKEQPTAGLQTRGLCWASRTPNLNDTRAVFSRQCSNDTRAVLSRQCSPQTQSGGGRRYSDFERHLAEGRSELQPQALMMHWLNSELERVKAENANLKAENDDLRCIMSGCRRCSRQVEESDEDAEWDENEPLWSASRQHSTESGIINTGAGTAFARLVTPIATAIDLADEEPFRRLVTPQESKFTRLVTPVACSILDSEAEEPKFARLITPDVSALEDNAFSRLVTPVATALEDSKVPRFGTPDASAQDDGVDEPTVFTRLVTPSIADRLRTPRDPCLASIELVRVAYSAFQARKLRDGLFIASCPASNMPDKGRKLNEQLRNLRQKFSELRGCDPRKFDHEQRLSFWLNVINAATLGWLCIIKKLPGQQGAFLSVTSWINFLQRSWINVGSKELNIFEIEHTILRAGLHPPMGPMVWLLMQAMAHRERSLRGRSRSSLNSSEMALQTATPEVSFGISYPIRDGCPALRIYRPESVKPQLLLNCAHYICRSLHVDISNREVTLPVLFNYYSFDFGASPAETLAYVQQVLEAVPGALADVAQLTGCRASLADLELTAESERLVKELDALRYPACKKACDAETDSVSDSLGSNFATDIVSLAATETTAASNPPKEASPLFPHVTIKPLDFDWQFDFAGQMPVCPEIEALNRVPTVPASVDVGLDAISEGSSLDRETKSYISSCSRSSSSCSSNSSSSSTCSSTGTSSSRSSSNHSQTSSRITPKRKDDLVARLGVVASRMRGKSNERKPSRGDIRPKLVPSLPPLSSKIAGA